MSGRQSSFLIFVLAVVIAMSISTGRAHATDTVARDATFEEVRDQVTDLFRTEKFDELDARMAALVADPVPFVSGKPKVLAAYWAFRDLFYSPDDPLPLQGERIGRWRSRYPGSPYVSFVESRYWYAKAWAERGEGAARSVRPDAWRVFAEDLEIAESILRKSPPELQATPLWHHLLLVIAQDSPKTKTDPDEVLSTALAKWPKYYSFYEVRASRLLPKWGGSWQGLDLAIARWTKDLAESDGTSLYARVYASLPRHGIPPAVFVYHWPALKESFTDLVTRFPDSGYRNTFASFACLAGDREQFTTVMATIPPGRVDRNAWLHEAQPAQCRRAMSPQTPLR